jgi:hypothetical protein
VPETPHVGAHTRESPAASADRATRRSPANRRVDISTPPIGCSECREWERRLSAGPAPLVKLDVRERPDLARKYGIAVVPTVLAVGANGTVRVEGEFSPPLDFELKVPVAPA